MSDNDPIIAAKRPGHLGFCAISLEDGATRSEWRRAGYIIVDTTRKEAVAGFMQYAAAHPHCHCESEQLELA